MPYRYYARLLYCFSFGAIALYTWVFAVMPLMGEDFAFSHGWQQSYEPSRLVWLFQRSLEQINGWNARLGEQLAIFWLNMPGWLFLTAAVLAVIGLAVLISLVYSGPRRLWLKAPLFLGLLFGLWPGLEVFFWKTVNAGYLQPLLLNMACVVAYRSAGTVRAWCRSRAATLGMCLIAVLAGLSFENVPVAVAIYMLLVLLMAADWRRLWPAAMPVAGLLVGWGALMMAPSTTLRREFYQRMFGVEHVDAGYYIQRGFEISDVFLRTSGELLALALASVGYLLFLRIKGHQYYAASHFMTVVPAVLVVGSLVMSPYTEPRAFALAWALMLAAVVEAAMQLGERHGWARAGLVLCLLVSAGVGVKTVGVYSTVAEVFGERDSRIINAARENRCDKGVAVSLAKFDYRYKYFNNRDSWYFNNLDSVGYFYDCKLVAE